MGIALHQSHLLERVELLVETGEVLDGLFHRLALAGEVFLFVACIGLVAQQLFRVLRHLLQIAEVVHIGIETRSAIEVEAYGHHDDDGYSDQQWLLTVEGVVVQTVYQREGLLVHLVLLCPEHLWQIDQREERRA